MKNSSPRQNHPTPSPQTQDNHPRCDWDFTISAVVSSPATVTATSSDTLGVIEFNSSGTHFATGGISRKIRIYNVNTLLSQTPPLDHATACHVYICTPAKLSSLRWKPASSGRVMGSADYDGVVTEYDLERRTPVFERDEHGGKRVWSMDYSGSSDVGASGSDDGTMQMWDPRCDAGKCVAKVQPSVHGSPVCCVEFDPYGGALVAVACADRRAYGYDVRNTSGGPVMVFDGHQKTVSYARFLDHRTVVTAGTDGCLKMWGTEDQRLLGTYRGHTNQRRFVGLSIWRNQGLIGSGSESNELFVYDKRRGEPIWVHGFGLEGAPGSEDGFVSSLCWSQGGEDECTLVAGGSRGVLKIFSCKRKSLSEI